LLDRLTDEAPEKSQESRDRRVISPRELHESVKRDLAWLLNTANLECTDDLSQYPQVWTSVVNYGVADLSGRTIKQADIPEIEHSLRRAILAFEPRILAKTLNVEVKLDSSMMSHNTLTFIIRGELWAHPVPLELFLRTDVDLETGNVEVKEGER
jgi:type VI secretion system protein ImpF